MKKPLAPEKFSAELEAWLQGKQSKTINSLSEAFAQKSFAVVVLLLMLTPALPLPTGGVTHIFEIVAMLLALEHIVGFDKIWLPNKLKNIRLAPSGSSKVAHKVIAKVRWFEQRSNPRLKFVFHHMATSKVIWLSVFAFSLVAFLAPPFSGLDTLPALGVVLICLSIILEDSLILFIGLLAGLLGTTIVIGLGALILDFIRKI